MRPTTQGGNANKSGEILENQIVAVFTAHGFKKVEAKEVLALMARGEPLSTFGDRWLTTQLAAYKNLYGAKFKTDVFVFEETLWPKGLVVECKYQRDGGSVDEKYVFTVMSLLNLPGDTLMLLTGGGARNCAIQWISDQQTKARRFTFCGSHDQFNNWVSRKLK